MRSPRMAPNTFVAPAGKLVEIRPPRALFRFCWLAVDGLIYNPAFCRRRGLACTGRGGADRQARNQPHFNVLPRSPGVRSEEVPGPIAAAGLPPDIGQRQSSWLVATSEGRDSAVLRAHARIAVAAVNGCLEAMVVIPATRAIGAVAENVIRTLAQRDAVHERQAKVTIRLPQFWFEKSTD
jgi:hypothetical protein